MNLNNRVKNRFEISEILKKLLLKVGKLDNIDLSTKADLIGGVVPASQLPSYVDDVLEFPSQASFPIIGEASKIYISTNNNDIYRWSGSTYIQIGSSGSTIPNLQQVTNTGNTTTNTIIGTIFQAGSNSSGAYASLNDDGSLFLKSNLGGIGVGLANIRATLLDGAMKIFNLPNKSGTIALTNDINQYSTNETVIGTWITGKPIYRKVITGTTNASGWWQMLQLQTSLSLKDFVSMNVLQLEGGGNYATTKTAVNNSGSLIVIPSSVAGATPWIGVQSYLSTSASPVSITFAVILEYTKITD